jgi:hypothetical protein
MNVTAMKVLGASSALALAAFLVAGSGCALAGHTQKERTARLQESVRAGDSRALRNLNRLHPGMSLAEVQELLGPMEHDYLMLMVALIERRQPGMRITFENGPEGSMNVREGDPDGHKKSIYTYHGEGYVLVFDWQGLLKEARGEKVRAETAAAGK